MVNGGIMILRLNVCMFKSSLKYYRHMEAILIPYRNTLKNKEKGNVGTDRKQGSQK